MRDDDGRRCERIGAGGDREGRRPVFAGLPLTRTLLMGVVNVTPDSFSDGGEVLDAPGAVARGSAMLDAGADILDVGGESTRPGAAPVTVAEEIARVVPVVRELAAAGAPVSIDTRRAAVMEAAIASGARIVNDVTALTGDPRSRSLIAETGVSVILMHMQGEPATMQLAPHYEDAAREVHGWLAEQVAACEAAGIGRQRIAVDPGIGFGKTADYNLEILAALDKYAALGCALVVGVSRKSFIGRLSRGEPPKQRLPGSLAAALAAVARGAHILRVHDVGETRQALSVWHAIAEAESMGVTPTRHGEVIRTM
ncbi:MAG: dihydropteroate synthase [Bacteroidota bacterium]